MNRLHTYYFGDTEDLGIYIQLNPTSESINLRYSMKLGVVLIPKSPKALF